MDHRQGVNGGPGRRPVDRAAHERPERGAGRRHGTALRALPAAFGSRVASVRGSSSGRHGLLLGEYRDFNTFESGETETHRGWRKTHEPKEGTSSVDRVRRWRGASASRCAAQQTVDRDDRSSGPSLATWSSASARRSRARRCAPASAPASTRSSRPSTPSRSTATPSGADPQDGFAFRLEEKDALGQTHVRMMQTYRGIRVLGGDLIVHVDDDGLLGINGRFVAGPRPPSASPALAPAESAGAAIGWIEARGGRERRGRRRPRSGGLGARRARPSSRSRSARCGSRTASSASRTSTSTRPPGRSSAPSRRSSRRRTGRSTT